MGRKRNMDHPRRVGYRGRMDRTPPKPAAAPRAETSRDARLKAALKANIARRKAQARARQDAPGDDTVTEKEQE